MARATERRMSRFWLGLAVAAMIAGCGGRSLQEAPSPDAGVSGVSSGIAGTAGATSGIAGASSGTADCVCQVGDACDAAVCSCAQVVCDGVCVDTQSDNANCGACGATCSVGCQAGRCVEVLASGLDDPKALAAGRTDLFWTTGLGLMQVAKAGGSPSVFVATSEGVASAIAVDDTYVYWSGSYDSKLMRAAIAAPTSELLADGQDDISAIVLDASAIYWDNWQTGTIMMLPKSGGAPRALTASAHRPTALAVDATHIYWTEDVSDAQGAVLSMPLVGGTPTTLASGQDGPRGMAINSTYVYWTATFDQTLSRVPLGGGAVELISPAGVYPEHVVLDDQFAYWVGNNGVEKVRLQGGTLAAEPGTEFVTDVAVDDTSVYFVQSGAGATPTSGSLVKVTPK
jgi:hypothetical protein